MVVFVIRCIYVDLAGGVGVITHYVWIVFFYTLLYMDIHVLMQQVNF